MFENQPSHQTPITCFNYIFLPSVPITFYLAESCIYYVTLLYISEILIMFLHLADPPLLVHRSRLTFPNLMRTTFPGFSIHHWTPLICSPSLPLLHSFQQTRSHHIYFPFDIIGARLHHFPACFSHLT